MTTILYSGYYNPDKDKGPFEVDPNFFYLTSCDLPNVTIIKHHKKDYVLVEIPDISNYDAEHFKMKLKHCFNAEIIDLKEWPFITSRQSQLNALSFNDKLSRGNASSIFAKA